MNELKPVAWMQQQGDYREPCSWEIDEDMERRGWRQEPLYIIPDTHRVVSVELLREFMRDIELWPEESSDAGKQLRAIIDNKGET